MTGAAAVQLPCTAIEPDLFFPPTYGVTAQQTVALAKTLCGRCTARERCLAVALARDEQFGIWGGTTPQERARLRARSRRSSATSA